MASYSLAPPSGEYQFVNINPKSPYYMWLYKIVDVKNGKREEEYGNGHKLWVDNDQQHRAMTPNPGEHNSWTPPPGATPNMMPTSGVHGAPVVHAAPAAPSVSATAGGTAAPAAPASQSSSTQQHDVTHHSSSSDHHTAGSTGGTPSIPPGGNSGGGGGAVTTAPASGQSSTLHVNHDSNQHGRSSTAGNTGGTAATPSIPGTIGGGGGAIAVSAPAASTPPSVTSSTAQPSSISHPQQHDNTGDGVSAGASDRMYTVTQGDNLTAIAEKHGMSVSHLEKLNPQIKNPNFIFPGEKVSLGAPPSSGGGAGAPSIPAINTGGGGGAVSPTAAADPAFPKTSSYGNTGGTAAPNTNQSQPGGGWGGVAGIAPDPAQHIIEAAGKTNTDPLKVQSKPE